MEFDAGMQTRRLYFGTPPGPGARSLQGYSIANWFKQPQNRGIFGRGGDSSAALSKSLPSILKRATCGPMEFPTASAPSVKEFFDTFTLPEDGSWLIVTTVIEDPEYLTQEFVLSTQFKKESDLSKWSPRPCEIPDPPPAQGTP